MPKMSSKDATFHATQDLMYALQNPEPLSPLVKLVNGNKEEFMTLSELFRKSSGPAVLPRVPVKEAFQEKLKQANQE